MPQDMLPLQGRLVGKFKVPRPSKWDVLLRLAVGGEVVIPDREHNYVSRGVHRLYARHSDVKFKMKTVGNDVLVRRIK